MLDKEGKRFCCWLNGYGQFEEEAQEWMDLPRKVSGRIQNQGTFEITGDKWKLEVGISHHDEEWCMTDDIKDFLLENHTFLHELAHGEQSYLHIGLSPSAVQGTCDLDGATLALLSSLRIGLSLNWGYPPKEKEDGTALQTEKQV